jgi:hypothetical protein
MSVAKPISLATVERQLLDCDEDVRQYGWVISPINEDNLSFTVKMTSPIDNEVFELYFQFDNYPEWPPLLDFIDPVSGVVGTKRAYPITKDGTFFHNHPIICNPCSRKSYSGHSGLHSEWSMVSWQSNRNTGSLTSIKAILQAISIRITISKYYNGRMEKK